MTGADRARAWSGPRSRAGGCWCGTTTWWDCRYDARARLDVGRAADRGLHRPALLVGRRRGHALPAAHRPPAASADHRARPAGRRAPVQRALPPLRARLPGHRAGRATGECPVTECAKCGDCCDPVIVTFEPQVYAAEQLARRDPPGGAPEWVRYQYQFFLDHWTSQSSRVDADGVTVHH